MPQLLILTTHKIKIIKKKKKGGWGVGGGERRREESQYAHTPFMHLSIDLLMVVDGHLSIDFLMVVSDGLGWAYFY